MLSKGRAQKPTGIACGVGYLGHSGHDPFEQVFANLSP